MAKWGRVREQIQRNLDREHKKLVPEVVDRTPEIPPPALVTVMGPPGVGKTSLIKVRAVFRPALARTAP